MAWQGNPDNNQPNPMQEGSNLSDRKKSHFPLSDVEKDGETRAVHTRRDNDIVKDVSVKLMDIDTIILNHVVDMQLSVVDDGLNVKVPVYYSSPEKWKSVQKDGVFRDYNGKIILPAIVFHRETSEKDTALATFNRYLRYPVMKKYSTKNKYTPFTALAGQNAPVDEIYDVVYPDHMIFTYKFILWTESVEQMNKLVERISFETEDYWGAPRGMRLRTQVDSYSHTVELQPDVDRLVKTDFNLVVHGYLLPESFNVEFARRPTTRKVLTPKKVLMGMETTTSTFDPNVVEDYSNKWRSQRWPNLPKIEEPSGAPMVWVDSAIGSSAPKDVVDAFFNIYKSTVGKISIFNMWASVPANSSAAGAEGQIAIDGSYLYIYSGGAWRRIAISAPSSPGAPGNEGQMAVDSEYFYIYSTGKWRRVAISQFI